MRSFTAVLLGLVLLLGATAPVPARQDGVLKATLSNGLRVVIVRDAIAPVVSTDMTYLAGSRDDPQAFPGMAHAQEHMMFRGTTQLSTQELGTIATALGGDFNAYTRETVTHYQFTVPASNLDAILRIESDRMHDVLDAQSQWQDERGAIEQEVARDEEIPGADFFRDAEARAFAGTPYAHPGVGTRASFDRLTGDDLKKFYRTWYAPNNAVFVVVGDVDPERTLAQIRGRFEGIARRTIPAHAAAHFKPAQRIEFRRPTSLVYPLAAVGFRMPGIHDADFIASFVLQGVLDAQRGPLRALGAEGAALEGQWLSMPYFPEAQLGFAVAALSPGSDPDAMVKRIERILTGYAKNGVPAELFASTKRRLIAGQELSRNSISSLASDWADVIALDEEPSIAHEQEMIKKITLADVNRVARKYFVLNTAIIGALTPSANGSARPPAAEHNTRENPLKPRPATSQLPEWAHNLVTTINVPPSATHPVTSKLSNGITLIVQPETISDSVLVYGEVKSNPVLQEPEGKEGISSVLAEMFNYGTATQDRLAFQRSLDDLGVSVSGGPGFGLQATSATFERGVALLARNELSPRLDQRTFAVARDRTAGSLEASLSGSHTTAIRQAARKLLPAGDPELREPTVRALQSMTLDDVKSYFNQTYRPDLTTVVVVGNVTPERAKAAVERSFGAWRSNGTPPASLELPPVPLNGPGVVRVSPPQMRQDSVTFEQVVEVRRTDPAYYPLTLGNAVLGGGAGGPEQSRLFRDLRQNAGLVYVVTSRLSAGMTRSRFRVEFACAPNNLERAQNVVDGDIAKMQTDLVPDFELNLTKAQMVRRGLVSQSATDAIGSALLDYGVNGLPLDEGKLASERFLATDAAAVRDAFAKYIKPQNFVRIIEGP